MLQIYCFESTSPAEPNFIIVYIPKNITQYKEIAEVFDISIRMLLIKVRIC